MWEALIPVVVACTPALLGPDTTAAQSKANNVDLVQIQLMLPKKVKPGKTFRVVDEVENQGTDPAIESITLFFLSSDDKFDQRDLVVAARRIPTLHRGQTHSWDTPVKLNAGIPPGNYYFLAVANAKRQIEERYFDNNVRAVAIEVTAK